MFLIFHERGVESGELSSAETGALASTGEKSAAVVACATVPGRRIEGDKTRQVFILTT